VQADELDVALDELETRLERLRALYEQYFLGIEKVEPAVARKDVDRRIWVLRREKIRNTAKRFKLQTIIQRYNTFQQYWQRILREIEAGTYRRHVLRAEKQFGSASLTIAAKKRAGMFRRGEEAAQARAALRDGTSEWPSSPPPDWGTESDMPSSLPPDASASSPPPHASAPVTTRPAAAAPIVPVPVRPILAPLQLDLGDLQSGGTALPTSTHTPARAAPPPLPKRAPTPAPPAQSAPVASDAPKMGGLSDERVKELHSRLIAAKHETNDATSVSVDGLARSLREAEKRLKAEHGDRTIDFDVVIKGGKAVVKPIVK
jgi:hypothetical protein